MEQIDPQSETSASAHFSSGAARARCGMVPFGWMDGDGAAELVKRSGRAVLMKYVRMSDGRLLFADTSGECPKHASAVGPGDTAASAGFVAAARDFVMVPTTGSSTLGVGPAEGDEKAIADMLLGD
jgi:hypothetical protein